MDNKENELPSFETLSADTNNSASPTSPELVITPMVENMNEKEHERVRFELLEIVDDMCMRLSEQNPSYTSGVDAFVRRYKIMKQKTISTPCIASALHMFGSEGEL